MQDKNKQIDYYHKLLEQYGDHHLSLDWKSPESQGIRYRVFEDLLVIGDKPKDFSLLDVGCGLGHLYEHSKKAGHRFSYAGYDIAPKLIEAAKKKHPGARFEVRDILYDDKPERFDFVFCCGALNVSFEERETHLDFIRAMLLRMFELCKIGVAVNFLSTQAVYYLPEESFKQTQYFYSNPDEIVKMIKGMAERFIVRHEYHLGDFTVYLLK